MRTDKESSNMYWETLPYLDESSRTSFTIRQKIDAVLGTNTDPNNFLPPVIYRLQNLVNMAEQHAKGEQGIDPAHDDKLKGAITTL